ncbi:copper transport protein ctr1 [Phlyctochytrium planicorne]|nr:copper transport protein ctr1 [Phlyctochytrium planicorne]
MASPATKKVSPETLPGDPVKPTIGNLDFDLAQAETLEVVNMAGQKVKLASFWKDQKLVIVFLRRFDCQTCFSYIVLFAHLKPILQNSNTRIIFVTCHDNLSEVQVFLTSFAYWLRTLQKGSPEEANESNQRVGIGSKLGALPGDLFLDPSRNSYGVFGIGENLLTSQRIALYLKFKYWNNTGGFKKVRSSKGLSKQRLYTETTRTIWREWFARGTGPKDRRIYRQSPGICVVDNGKLLYRFVCRDQQNPVPGASDLAFAEAIACPRDEATKLDEVVQEDLAKFVDLVSEKGSEKKKVASNELVLEKELGSGKESVVYKATWMGISVAVKYFRTVPSKDQSGEDTEAESIQSFSNEVSMLLSLRHRNVITMMGFGAQARNFFLVAEFMPKGSLFQVLEDMRIPLSSEPDFGIATLRERRFLDTLLGEDEEEAKRNEANTSGMMPQKKGAILGTLQWLSPEHLTGKDIPSTTKSDVYAFGVIMWEVGSRKKPWKGVPFRKIVENVLRGDRPPIPTDVVWNQDFQDLLHNCWAQDPLMRPEFARVVKQLKKISVPLSGIAENLVLGNRLRSKMAAAKVSPEPQNTEPKGSSSSHPEFNLKQAESLEVINMAGQKVKLASFWKDQKLVIVFLRRFHCQTCFSYIVLFAHLRPILENSNTRIVFVTCHDSLSEVQIFLSSFAYWLRSLQKSDKSGEIGTGSRLGALPGELFLDPQRNSYRIFGIGEKLLKRQRYAQYFQFASWKISGGFNKKKRVSGNRSQVHKEVNRTVWREWFSRGGFPKDKKVMNQSGGIAVVEKGKLLYRYVIRDQNKVVPGQNDESFMDALACPKEDVQNLDETVEIGLKDFVNLVVDTDIKKAKVSHNELVLHEELGNGKESIVYKATWMRMPVAVKYFRTTQEADDGVETLNEMETIQSFSNEVSILLSLRHPNIIQMMGFGAQSPSFFLITEFMPRGCIFDM